MTDPTPELKVTYSGKELLARIDRKLESIDHKLDTKADLRDVLDLRQGFDHLRNDVGNLKQRFEEQVAVSSALAKQADNRLTKREKMAAIVSGIGLLAVQIALNFHIH